MHPELFKIPVLNWAIPSYGAIVMVAFLVATWWAGRRARQVKQDPEIALNLALIALIFSTIGARAFYVIHYWDSQFAHNPAQIINLRAGGMELYGGLIGGFVSCYLYLLIKRISLRLWADIVAPGLLMAMGIGRIACFMYGCCWGGPCDADFPLAVQFPFASPPHTRHWEDRLVTLPARAILGTPSGISGLMPRELMQFPLDKLETKLAEATQELEAIRDSDDPDVTDEKREKARTTLATLQQAAGPILEHYHGYGITPEQLRNEVQGPAFLSRPIHPAQLYAATGPILLAWLTHLYFYRRRRHGMVMVVGFMLYPIQRFIEEIIRADNPHDTFGLTVSQGVSIVIFLVAGTWFLILRQLPLRSPRAVPFVPPPGKK